MVTFSLQLETDRPIIWLCHDLGGTIVKEVITNTVDMAPFVQILIYLNY